MSPHIHTPAPQLFGRHSLFFSMPRHAALACLLFGLAFRSRSRSADWTLAIQSGSAGRNGGGGGGGVWWDGFGPGQVAATSQSLSVTFVIVVCCLLHTVGKMGKIWCGAGGLGHGYVNKKPNSKLADEASPRITKGGEERAKNRSASSEFRIPLHLARIWTDKRNLFYIRNFKKQASISKSN